jgi:hypothetical protein
VKRLCLWIFYFIIFRVVEKERYNLQFYRPNEIAYILPFFSLFASHRRNSQTCSFALASHQLSSLAREREKDARGIKNEWEETLN